MKYNQVSDAQENYLVLKTIIAHQTFLAMGKGMGGGMPVGAFSASSELMTFITG